MSINRSLRRYKYKVVVPVVVIILIMYYYWTTEKQETKIFDLSSKNEHYFPKEMKTFLLVLIMTGPKNKERRDAIRETWLSNLKRRNENNSERSTDILHYFVIGINGLNQDAIKSIEEENLKQKDLLILEDFTDSYNKLTQKLGLVLQWVERNVEFKYIFKADDDTFVRLNVIEEELRKRSISKPSENLYMGYFYGRGRVKKSGPWKEIDWNLCDFYLPYARGGGYILSSSVAGYVANNFHMFKQYLSEDVSLGAWLAPLKVNRIHDVRFDTEYKSRGCSNTHVVSHKQSIDDMKVKHKNLQKNGKLCEKEIIVFNGYIYNWDVPPSQCCVRTKGIP